MPRTSVIHVTCLCSKEKLFMSAVERLFDGVGAELHSVPRLT
jgi:hypothetical protein